MKQKLALQIELEENEYVWKEADKIEFIGGDAIIFNGDGRQYVSIHDIEQIIPIEIKSAKFADGEISVNHAVRTDVGKEFISWEIDGWEEVKKYVKKVMTYDGRRFAFSCWNSDRMEITFSRGLREEIKTANLF